VALQVLVCRWIYRSTELPVPLAASMGDENELVSSLV